MAKPLTELLAELAQIRARRELRKQVVHVAAVVDNQRVSVPHLLVGGKLLELTPAQIAELKEDT